MDVDTEAAARRSEHDEAYRKNLSTTKDELQDLVTKAEAELAKLNRTRPADGLHIPPSRHLEVMRAAFERATNTDPFLPFRHSVLPALLAMRRAHQTIAESQTCLAELSATIDDTRRRQLDVDAAALEDQRAMTRALEARLETLRTSAADVYMDDIHSVPDADQAARDRIAELGREKIRYDDDAETLRQAINKFVNERLAVLLAAEDLGGPVVGDGMDVDDDVLAGGFTVHGRPKKVKQSTARTDDRRQLRLDQIWGPAAAVAAGDGDQASEDAGVSREAAAAAREMRDLLSSLVIGAVQAHEQDSVAAWVPVERESAAVRFLVRARAAQFHPRDAGRIRLVDFGRELDD